MLSREEIQNLLSNRGNVKDIIAEAKDNEDRLALHTQVALTSSNVRGLDNYFKYVDGIMQSAEKSYLLKRHIRFPVETNATSGKIFRDLSSIFNGCDPVREYRFKDEKYNVDRAEYWEQRGLNQFWQDECYKQYQTAYNSLMVVDLPQKQLGSRPEPYIWFLSIGSVLNYKMEGGKFAYVIFVYDENKIGVYDKDTYQVWNVKEGTYDLTTLESNSRHSLKEAPLYFIAPPEVSSKETIKRCSILSEHMSSLDFYLTYAVSKKASDLQDAWPITWSYQEDCDWNNDNFECNGGFMYHIDQDQYIMDGDRLKPCPKCGTTKIGPAIHVKMPIPNGDDAPDLAPPVGRVSAEVDNLRYLTEEVKRREQDIISRVTGKEELKYDKQALNEKQVESMYESQETVLNQFQRSFEKAQRWAERMICLLRYPDQFIGLNIHYGTEHYIVTAQKALKDYTDAKNSQQDHSVLDILHDKYLQSKYRNDKQGLIRQQIIVSIDPCRHLSTEEVKDLLDRGQISNTDYYLKVNMSSSIRRFEIENGSIEKYKSDADITLAKKIEEIKAEMAKYVINS